MRARIRLLVVILISLLLPLQGSLAFARSVAMAVKPLAAAPAGQHQHAAHSGHHHAAQTAVNLAPDAAEHHAPAAAVTSSSASPHKHASNACDNCAKCCLSGAAAPPSVSLLAPDAMPARILFKPSSDSLSGFIADGPERPPRYLSA